MRLQDLPHLMRYNSIDNAYEEKKLCSKLIENQVHHAQNCLKRRNKWTNESMHYICSPRWQNQTINKKSNRVLKRIHTKGHQISVKSDYKTVKLNYGEKRRKNQNISHHCNICGKNCMKKYSGTVTIMLGLNDVLKSHQVNF
jgi:hypothetical protein